MINPEDNHHPVPFEWKIDRVPETKINRRVREWRVSKCGKKICDYESRFQEYCDFVEAQDPTAVRPAPGPSQLPIPRPRRKRGGNEADAGPGPGTSYKRRSMGAQWSASSLWGASSSQSAMSSPESSRPPPLAASGGGGLSPPCITSSPSMVGSPPSPGAGMYGMSHVQPSSPSFGSQSSIGSQTPSIASASYQSPSLGSFPGQRQPPSVVGSAESIISGSSTGQESRFSTMAISQPGPSHRQQPLGYGDSDSQPAQMIQRLGMPPMPTFLPGGGSGQPAPNAGFARPQYGSDHPGLRPQNLPGVSQDVGNYPGMYGPAQPRIPPPRNAPPMRLPGMAELGIASPVPPSGIPPPMTLPSMSEQGIAPHMHRPRMSQPGRGMASQTTEFGSSHSQSMSSNPQHGGPYPYQVPSQGGWNSEDGGPAPGNALNYPGGACNPPGYQGQYPGRGGGSGHG